MAKQIEIVATMKGGRLIPLDLFADDIAEIQDGAMVQVFIEQSKPEKIRTIKQNRSMWKWAKNMADALNASGFDKRKFYEAVLSKGGQDLPWSKESVIDDLWRPYQEAITGKKSTTKPSTSQYIEIYDHVNHGVSRMTNGISVQWPCRESQSYEDNRY